MAIYGNPICANCRYFTWAAGATDDRGRCRRRRRTVDARQAACRAFDFDPPEARKPRRRGGKRR